RAPRGGPAGGRPAGGRGPPGRRPGGREPPRRLRAPAGGAVGVTHHGSPFRAEEAVELGIGVDVLAALRDEPVGDGQEVGDVGGRGREERLTEGRGQLDAQDPTVITGPDPDVPGALASLGPGREEGRGRRSTPQARPGQRGTRPGPRTGPRRCTTDSPPAE